MSTGISIGMGMRVFALARALPLLLVLGLGPTGCTLDLTEPFLQDDSPATLTIQFTLTEESEGLGCWTSRVTARPRFESGQLVFAADSTLWVDGVAYAPKPRPHELAVFVYETPAQCGARPAVVALDLPMVEETAQLPWPLEALPLPWSGIDSPAVLVVPAGATALIPVPGISLPAGLPGRSRVDLTARVVRGPGAPASQQDHLLLSNLPQGGLPELPLGAPFTSVVGTRWRIQWGVFLRVDTTTPGGILNAAVQYGVFLFSDVRVEAPDPAAALAPGDFEG
jgi:hypothetical protein